MNPIIVAMAVLAADLPPPRPAPPLAAPVLESLGCAQRDGLIAALLDRFGEGSLGLGVSDSGSVVEVFRSERTGTWSLLLTLPDGRTCLLAAGGMWVTTPTGDPA